MNPLIFLHSRTRMDASAKVQPSAIGTTIRVNSQPYEVVGFSSEARRSSMASNCSEVITLAPDDRTPRTTSWSFVATTTGWSAGKDAASGVGRRPFDYLRALV